MENKWICRILALAMLRIPLSGCNKSDEKADTTKKPATAGNPLPAGALALVHEFAAGDINGIGHYYCSATKTYTTDATSEVNGERVTNTFAKFIPTTAEGLLPGIAEIFAYVNGIDVLLP